ncbi:MAG: hypothetical protein KDK08_26900 [Rhizobiaceae bacterium]|nr:hypothetical protein [Rhizobiaceae bacterium]
MHETNQSIIFSSALLDILSAVFGHVKGRPRAVFGNEIVAFDTPDNLLKECLSRQEYGFLDLTTETGEAAGIGLRYRRKEVAGDALGSVYFGSPSLILSGPDDEYHLYILAGITKRQRDTLILDYPTGAAGGLLEAAPAYKVPLPYGPYSTRTKAGRQLSAHPLDPIEFGEAIPESDFCRVGDGLSDWEACWAEGNRLAFERNHSDWDARIAYEQDLFERVSGGPHA